MHCTQLDLVGAVYLKKKVFLHIIVQTPDWELRVIDNLPDILWVPILCYKALPGNVMYKIYNNMCNNVIKLYI